MSCRKYRALGVVNNMKKIIFYQVAFLFMVMCFASGAFAGTPVGGEVYFYNVKSEQFSVVWEVDNPSTCTVEVYTDIDGTNPISPTIVSNTDNSPTAQDRGVMQVDVSNLPTEDTTYYVRTVSTGKVTGSFTDTSTYSWPALGSLLPVTTEPGIVGIPEHANGTLLVSFYDDTPNPGDISENQLQDIVAIVDAGGDYPVSSTEGSGWPIPDYYLVTADFTPTLHLDGSYWVWDKTDHPITIHVFGGQVPGIGKGKKIIDTTYPATFIDDETNYPYGGCLGDQPNPPDECDTGFGGVVNMYSLAVAENKCPDFELDTDLEVNRNATLTINVCASDPEGDAIANIELIDEPGGMNIQFPDPSDANCAIITWTPTECGTGTYENIKVKVSDDQGNSCSKAFNVSIKSCPPYEPGASIGPQSPTSTQDLTCDAVSNGDPDGDTITLIYAWYDGANPGIIISTTATLNSSETQKGKQYFCSVIARDKDGDSVSKIVGPLTVANSPPSAPGSAIVSPDDPPADQGLTCTITEANDPDIGDSVQYIYQWKCTNCGTKTVASHGPKSEFTDTLASSNTAKGENWSCDVVATDNTAQGPTRSSNTVNIANLPPPSPGNVQITNTPPVKTGDNLTCTIAAVTDPDEDPVKYVFTWKCTGSNCGQPSIERAPKDGTSDTLASSNTAKDQTWSCEVWAQDNFGGKSATVSASPVTIENSPPAGLSAQVDPDPANVNNNLTCTASGVTDADGDDISYKYVWKKDGAIVVTKDFTEGITTDTITADNTSQGETWSCEVTARDDSGAQVGPTISNEVLIDNLYPEVTTDPTAEKYELDEGGSYDITILVSDPDGNETTLVLDDANSVDLNDPNVSDWLTFDSVNYILTANPPAGGSSINVGFGPGVFKFNFIVEDDGTPIRRVEKLVEVEVRVPAEIVDNFEYSEDKPTLAANGWYKLQGSGNMLLKQEDPNDPNSNHYLKTTVSKTPTNNSQLNYIIYKTMPPNHPFTNVYPEIWFSVNDKNLYYFDVFVRARNNAGVEDNYFLRYIPQDPNDVGWTQKFSGNYVRTNIGKQSVDPNGNIIEVSRNMDLDLFNATGFHYLYLKGIVLRGDIDFLDDIMVRSAGPQVPLKDVADLTAQGNENQVTLQWTLPSSQAGNIAGYKIYMNTNTAPAKDETFYIATVTPDKTSYTKTGLANGVTYCFRVTAVNNLLTPNETSGKTACATPEVTVPLDPIDLNAKPQDGTIELTWKNPPDQHPDLAGYMVYYCNCVSGDCSGCYGVLVAADNADPNGRFTLYITKDANQDDLQYDNTYDFTVKAKDTAQPANLSDGMSVSIKLTLPTAKLIDNFDLGYEQGETLMRRGWYRLQGKGSFKRKLGVGINNYLEVKGPADYMVVKWLTNPSDFTNPNLSMLIRSLGDFRVDVYLKGKDGKNYFLSYKGDKNSEEDSPDHIVEQKRFILYKLGWKNKVSTEWYEIQRDLNEDLLKAKGIEFDMVLGFLLRGTLDIDNITIGEGILDAENLTARPGETSVLLSWTLVDPNKSDETRIYVDGNLVTTTIAPSSNKNDYEYEVTGLTTDTTYEFTVVQVAEGDESKGVSVSATPVSYRTTPFTFDDPTDLNEWPLSVSAGVDFNVVYDSGVQSNVMYLNPDSPYPDRYYAANENMDVSDVTGMTCRIKTSSNFVIWLQLEDTSGLPFMLGFVPGGTAGTHSRFGNFAYYFIGPGLTDGKWHLLDLPLDDVMVSIFTGIGTDKINGIYFGGRIYVDDVSIY